MVWTPRRSGPSLAIYDRASSLALPPGYQVEQLAFSTVAPGGCEACRFVLLRRATLLYPDLEYNFDVRLSDEQGIFWRGRIDAVMPVITEADEYIQVTALGGAIAADDQVYTSKAFAAATAIETAVSTVRTDLMATIVTEESLVTTGRSFVATTTYTGIRARSILEELSRFGMSTNVALQWAVWPDGTNYAYRLVLEARPQTATYTINVLDFEHQGGFDGSLYFNRVRINYNTGATWAMVEDTTEQTVTGRIREQVITAPEITNATDAAHLGDVALDLSSARRVQATGGRVANRYAIRDSNGLVVHPWRVRAGQLLYIQGRMGTGQAGALDWGNTSYIKATSYDDDSGVLTLTFERDDTTLEGMISRLTKQTQI